MNSASIKINNRTIGTGHKTYIIAEMSANHNQDFAQAVKIIEAAKESGADAIKIQTYTADTMTIASDKECFQIKGTVWEGKTLHDLYKEAYTPWDWQPKLKTIAEKLGLDFFSSPFDETAISFLEKMDVALYKVASFEVVDLPLIKQMAKTGKPIIMSVGMATREEIDDAVEAIKSTGNSQIVLLKCTSAYPASPTHMNLQTIPELARIYRTPVGLSDHTMGISVPVSAVALGASVIEKHFILSRSHTGPDSTFSLEPHEFKAMVEAVRTTEQALGQPHIGPSPDDIKSRDFRRSLFVVEDIKAGEIFSAKNVRSIRPGFGLPPKFFEKVLGKKAKQDISRGTPLNWDLIV